MVEMGCVCVCGGGGLHRGHNMWNSGRVELRNWCTCSVKPMKMHDVTFQVLGQWLSFLLLFKYIMLIPPQTGYYSSDTHPILPCRQTIIFFKGGGQSWGITFFLNLRLCFIFVLVGYCLWNDFLTLKKQDMDSGKHLISFFPWLVCAGISFWKLPSPTLTLLRTMMG